MSFKALKVAAHPTSLQLSKTLGTMWFNRRESPATGSTHTWSAWMSIMKALRLQDMSCSPSRKLAISSGASGIRKSKFLKHKHRFGLLEIRSRGWEKLSHFFFAWLHLVCLRLRVEVMKNLPFLAWSWSVWDHEWRLWEINLPFSLGVGQFEIMSRSWEKKKKPFSWSLV